MEWKKAKNQHSHSQKKLKGKFGEKNAKRKGQKSSNMLKRLVRNYFVH